VSCKNISILGTLCSVLTLFVAWLTWNQIPANLAIHVDENGVGTLFLPRETYLAGAIGLIAFECAVLIKIATPEYHRMAAFAACLLLVETCLLLCVFGLNAGSTSIFSHLIEGLSFVLTLVIFAGVWAFIALTNQTQAAPLNDATIQYSLHHESKRSKLAALGFMAIPALLVMVLPDTLTRGLVLLGGLAGVWATLLVWTGFEYQVTNKGVTVRTFFRKSYQYDRADITQCSVVDQTDALSDWGGWGIRGGEKNRAFLLGGTRGVRIELNNRTVLLGTDSPEKLHAAITGLINENEQE